MTQTAMANDSETLRRDLIDLLTDFERHLRQSDLRQQVQQLIPANKLMQNLGSSLLPNGLALSAHQRIINYLRRYPGEVIEGDELMVVAGISEYARRIRELRVEQGWPILSGNTAADLRKDYTANEAAGMVLPPVMKPDQYMLVEDKQDREAAHRWHTANSIRKSDGGAQDKILRFFLANVGKPVTSEELKYVAGKASEWARRTRELRTEEGWPVITRNSGDPQLPVGVYVLMSDKQAPQHDRHISELTRREVMRRDNWSCRWRGCGWPHGFPDTDHRYLEAHHIEHHAAGGSNDEDNLITLCNLHHDETHRTGVLDLED